MPFPSTSPSHKPHAATTNPTATATAPAPSPTARRDGGAALWSPPGPPSPPPPAAAVAEPAADSAEDETDSTAELAEEAAEPVAVLRTELRLEDWELAADVIDERTDESDDEMDAAASVDVDVVEVVVWACEGQKRRRRLWLVNDGMRNGGNGEDSVPRPRRRGARR